MTRTRIATPVWITLTLLLVGAFAFSPVLDVIEILSDTTGLSEEQKVEILENLAQGDSQNSTSRFPKKKHNGLGLPLGMALASFLQRHIVEEHGRNVAECALGVLAQGHADAVFGELTASETNARGKPFNPKVYITDLSRIQPFFKQIGAEICAKEIMEEGSKHENILVVVLGQDAEEVAFVVTAYVTDLETAMSQAICGRGLMMKQTTRNGPWMDITTRCIEHGAPALPYLPRPPIW